MELTREKLKELLDYEPASGIFKWKVRAAQRIQVGDVAGSRHVAGYVSLRVLNKLYLAHRVAWFYVYGCWPTIEIDHANGIRTDNRIANLREANSQQNKHNTHKPFAHNTSGFLGVSYANRERKWRATIAVNRKSRSLGYFDSPEEAHAAYKAAKMKVHPFSIQTRSVAGR